MIKSMISQGSIDNITRRPGRQGKQRYFGCPNFKLSGFMLWWRGIPTENALARAPEIRQHSRMLGGYIMRRTILALLLLAGPLAAHAGGILRIGLNEDPDALDPARGGSFVGRLVFAAVCDKLIDTDQNNDFVPQLATSWAWSPDNLALTVTLRDGVLFQDGEHFDAEAARVNLERYRNAPESLRKGELKPVAAVEVIDPKTIRLRLSQPYAPLVAALSDRAGMMVSPKGIARLGANLADDFIDAPFAVFL